MKSSLWKIILVLGAILLGAALLVPKALRDKKDTLHQESAGTHLSIESLPHTKLVLNVNTDSLAQQAIQKLSWDYGDALQGGQIKSSQIIIKDGSLLIAFKAANDNEPGLEILRGHAPAFEGGAKSVEISEVGTRRYKAELTPGYLDYLRVEATRGSAELLPDLFQLQKHERLEANIYGQRAIELRYANIKPGRFADMFGRINTASIISFHEVVDVPLSVQESCVERDLCPQGSRAYPHVDGDHLILKTHPVLTSIDVSKAATSVDPRSDAPSILVSFSESGSRRYCNFTAAHIGGQLALVSHGLIETAPRINEPICGGRSSLTGGFTMVEAEDFALAINVGTLPAKLRVVEEQIINPESAE